MGMFRTTVKVYFLNTLAVVYSMITLYLVAACRPPTIPATSPPATITPRLTEEPAQIEEAIEATSRATAPPGETGANAPQLIREFDAGQPVFALALSPSNRLLAAGCEDGRILLWSYPNGQSLHTLEGHQSPVRALAFSPDGQTLASGDDDALVRMWDAATGEERYRLEGHESPIVELVFSPDGQTLVSIDESYQEVRNRVLYFMGSRMLYWDVSTGERTSYWPMDGLTFVEYLADSDQIVTGGRHGIAIIPVGRDGVKYFDSVDVENTAAVTPDEQSIVIAPDLSMYSLAELELLFTFDNENVSADGLNIHTLAFSPDGSLLAADNTTQPGAITLWNATNGSQVSTFEAHDVYSGIRDLLFSPDGLLISGGRDGLVRVWQLP